MTSITEQRDESGLLGLNGRTGELVRWVVGLAMSAIVAYFSAQASVTNRLTAVETTQRLQFEEIQRSLSDLKLDVREVKTAVREGQ